MSAATLSAELARCCDRCGAEFPKPPPGGGASGYAILPNGGRICYACSNMLEVGAMARAERYTAYLSSDGTRITDWPGGVLATVITTRPTFRHGQGWYAVRARDVHGAIWYGRGQRGMVLTLRRAKAGGAL